MSVKLAIVVVPGILWARIFALYLESLFRPLIEISVSLSLLLPMSIFPSLTCPPCLCQEGCPLNFGPPEVISTYRNLVEGLSLTFLSQMTWLANYFWKQLFIEVPCCLDSEPREASYPSAPTKVWNRQVPETQAS